jgi:hypothetical protein
MRQRERTQRRGEEIYENERRAAVEEERWVERLGFIVSLRNIRRTGLISILINGSDLR